MTATQTRGDQQATAARDRGMSSAAWRALGTSVQLVVGDPEQLPAARAAVARVLDEVDRAASRFRDDSELRRLSPGRWNPISPVLHRYLSAALAAAQDTDGLVDPTVGNALVDLGYDRTFRLVTEDGPAITVAMRPAPGWQSVLLEPDRVLVPEGILLDLGATAKGLAADIAAEQAAAVAGSVLVSLGGDIAVAGDCPPGGWPILITDNADPDLIADGGQVILLPEGGLATSGTSARRWQRGGQLIHHLIDPRSGTPTSGPWQTASVAAYSCLDANIASTAAVVLGNDAASWLRQRSLSAILTRADGSWITTGGWPPRETS
ncbi:MAG: FAD:protein transferase [Actinomycetota bacterium]|nr:FAD:protein transferase [Actinomycetota bacterium]